MSVSTQQPDAPTEPQISQLRLDGTLELAAPSPAELTALIEALLIVAPAPPTMGELAEATGVEERAIEVALTQMGDQPDRGWIVQRHGSTVHLASAPRFARHVRAFLGLEREGKLSSAALETLAIIAYRQPITRAEIDAIRGVDSSGVLATLHARELVESVGRVASVGNPFQYGTTPGFLRLFGLRSLDDLPSLGLVNGLPAQSMLAALEPVSESAPEADSPNGNQDAS